MFNLTAERIRVLMKRGSGGFTLLELMVTIAIVAIVLTLGVPSFQETIRNNRLITTVNDFISSLNLTRSEAIKRGVSVTLCKSANGTSCDTSSTGYQQGWIIFANPNGNTTLDSSEQIIRVYGAIAGVNLTGNTNVINFVSYVANGMTTQPGTVTICIAAKGYSIVISGTGRASTTEVTCS